MRIVVAGGSGMIGRHLVASLASAGHSVSVLSRDPGRAQERLPEGVTAVRWTATRDLALVAALDSADAVINLAGESIGPRPWTPGRKRAILDSRLRSTEALVGAMGSLPPERRPRTLLNASGTDVYVGRDAEPADETTEPGPGYLSHVCLAWEAAARQAEPLGMRVAILRQAFVLARDAASFRLLVLPFRMFLGGRLGDGRQWFSWIHVDDLVGLYRLVLDDPSMSGVMNAASPRPVQEHELATALGRAVHRPNWLPVPAALIRLAMGEQSTLVLGSKRAVPVRAIAAGYRFRYEELDDAVAQALGRHGPVGTPRPRPESGP